MSKKTQIIVLTDMAERTR